MGLAAEVVQSVREPDPWEIAHDLDPHNATDGAAVAANGYTNVENYLNELAGDPIPGSGN